MDTNGKRPLQVPKAKPQQVKSPRAKSPRAQSPRPQAEYRKKETTKRGGGRTREAESSPSSASVPVSRIQVSQGMEQSPASSPGRQPRLRFTGAKLGDASRAEAAQGREQSPASSPGGETRLRFTGAKLVDASRAEAAAISEPVKAEQPAYTSREGPSIAVQPAYTGREARPIAVPPGYSKVTVPIRGGFTPYYYYPAYTYPAPDRQVWVVTRRNVCCGLFGVDEWREGEVVGYEYERPQAFYPLAYYYRPVE